MRCYPIVSQTNTSSTWLHSSTVDAATGSAPNLASHDDRLGYPFFFFESRDQHATSKATTKTHGRIRSTSLLLGQRLRSNSVAEFVCIGNGCMQKRKSWIKTVKHLGVRWVGSRHVSTNLSSFLEAWHIAQCLDLQNTIIIVFYILALPLEVWYIAQLPGPSKYDHHSL